MAGSILSNDENYDFIRLTLTTSLDELYCEQMGEETAFFSYVKKTERPIKPLNKEEQQIFAKEPAYGFIFTEFYTIPYAITDPEALTVEQRDATLQIFCTELQSYIDGLSETELMNSNI